MDHTAAASIIATALIVWSLYMPFIDVHFVLPFQRVSLTSLSISYTQNGILHMLDRNRRIKSRPERFQDTDEQFDVIFTVEERIYDSVLEGNG